LSRMTGAQKAWLVRFVAIAVLLALALILFR
jgi:hypothetical protein